MMSNTLDLLKARYIARVATGNPSKPFKYVYAKKKQKAGRSIDTESFDLKISQGTKLGDYQVKEVDAEGKLVLVNQKTQKEVIVSKAKLQEKLEEDKAPTRSVPETPSDAQEESKGKEESPEITGKVSPATGVGTKAKVYTVTAEGNFPKFIIRVIPKSNEV